LKYVFKYSKDSIKCPVHLGNNDFDLAIVQYAKESHKENLPNSTLNRDTFYVLNSTINQTVQFFKIRGYSTLNRVIWENFRTVHLMETVQLIESSE